jgi:hypothetical protein
VVEKAKTHKEEEEEEDGMNSSKIVIRPWQGRKLFFSQKLLLHLWGRIILLFKGHHGFFAGVKLTFI